MSGASRTFIPGRRVDDAAAAVAEFSSGAIGTIEVSRVSLGHRNSLRLEIEGSRASLAFDLERLNELRVFEADANRLHGYKTVLASDTGMPYASWWWPPGHILGWEHSFVHEIHHLLQAIASDGEVGPHGATFEDGYRAAVVCDAIQRSGELGARQTIEYDSLAREVIGAWHQLFTARRASAGPPVRRSPQALHISPCLYMCQHMQRRACRIPDRPLVPTMNTNPRRTR